MCVMSRALFHACFQVPIGYLRDCQIRFDSFVYFPITWPQIDMKPVCPPRLLQRPSCVEFSHTAIYVGCCLRCEWTAYIPISYFNAMHYLQYKVLRKLKGPHAIVANLQFWADAQRFLFAWTMLTDICMFKENAWLWLCMWTLQFYVRC